ncbi:MAG: NAD(P)-dependent oxidoreductase [Flammeovirgaceae bacterium]
MKKQIIHHDFNLNLKLYTIPSFFINEIKKEFSNVCFVDSDLEYDKKNIEIFFGNRINNQKIEEYKNLKWIHLGCVGYDSIDVELLRSKNILMTNSSGLLTNSMVEHILNFMTSFSRGMNYINLLRNKKLLDRENFDNYFEKVTNLSNLKVLICGFGNVGNKLVKILEHLDMEIYTISRTKKSNYKNFSLSDIGDLASKVDYIINLLPLSDETENLFDSKLFSKMNNVSFINLGRGKTVNEKDLIEAIANGNLNSAALDVFEVEPLSLKSKLFEYDNILLTPHIAGLDSNYWNRQLDLFKNNLRLYFEKKNKSLKNRII